MIIRDITETMTAGATGSGGFAASAMPLGKTRKRNKGGVYEGDNESLAQAIQSGQPVKVIDASYSRDGHSMGDLRNLGWAKKNIRRGGSYQSVNWTYTGPEGSVIIVNGKEMRPGDETEEMDVDYS